MDDSLPFQDKPEMDEVTSEPEVESEVNSEEVVKQEEKPESHNPTVKLYPEKKGVNKKLMLIVAGVLALILGFFIFRKGSGDVPITIESESTLGVKEEPSPAPTQIEVNKGEIKIEVLNGTGIAREASFLKEKLQGLGFKIIEVGNTEEQYEAAQFLLSESLPQGLIDEVGNLLKNVYKEVKTQTSEDLDVDISIITGLRQGQTLPPTPTPTSKLPTPTKALSPTPSAVLTTSPTPTP